MDSATRKVYNDYIASNGFEAARIRFKEELPKSLLFFTSHVSKTLANVEKSEIWLSTPSSFNDPFDCALDLYLDENNFGIDDILEDSIQKKCLGKEQYRNTVCIRCFSEVDNLTSLRMWGYYADNHKGICLEYEMDGLHLDYMLPVIYEKIPSVKFKTIEEARRYLLCSKAEEWEFEKEWRLILKRDNYIFKEGTTAGFIRPKSIYIGCKAANEDEEVVRRCCRENGIKVFKMKQSKNAFELICEEIK